MKKIFLPCFLAALLVVLNTAALASKTISVTPSQGKSGRSGTAADTVQSETRLVTRGTSPTDARKSWMQFDMASIYAEDASIPGHITTANLTMVGANSETGAKSYVVNGMNDSAGLEGWVASTLTWNNAPANDTASAGGLITTQTVNLYTNSFAVPCLGVVSDTPEANRAALSSFLNTDTDGKITFILTAGSTTYLKGVGDPNGPVLSLTYTLGYNVKKAHAPSPADEAIAKTSLSTLSWTNPDPNNTGGIITCDVYFGTEPNRLSMDKKTLGAGVSSVAINTTNFPTYGALTDMTTYYWIVDVHDTTNPDVVNGQEWRFYANNNEAPIVNAGPDQVVWLGKSGVTGQEVVTLDGTVTDDGLPNPPAAYTVTWTQVSGPTVTISPNNTVDTTVTLTATGTYVFQLAADDTNRQASDTVQIVVGNNSCHASYLNGATYNAMDFNQDCQVDFTDFADFASDWLVCTNSQTGC